MKNQGDKRAAFIIAGMHRSGTSLTSSLMEDAGINIGTRLIEATPDNPKGHFENLDFVEFHVNVLGSQGGHCKKKYLCRNNFEIEQS
jgi:O-antigen biosynthesis protein